MGELVQRSGMADVVRCGLYIYQPQETHLSAPESAFVSSNTKTHVSGNIVMSVLDKIVNECGLIILG